MFESFPKARLEFEATFTREEDCLDYLARLRWPDGFVCPKCGRGKHWAGSLQGIMDRMRIESDNFSLVKTDIRLAELVKRGPDH